LEHDVIFDVDIGKHIHIDSAITLTHGTVK